MAQRRVCFQVSYRGSELSAITYTPGIGWLHRLNPMLKGWFVLCLASVFSIHDSGYLFTLAVFLGLIIAAFSSGVSLKPATLSLKSISVLLVAVGLVQFFRAEEAVRYASTVDAVFKIIGIFFSAAIFVTISSQSELTFFWESCFKPLGIFGISTRELALVMVIAVRFLPVIIGEVDRIKLAQMARGADFSSTANPIKNALRVMPLLVPVIVMSIQRASDLALAMEARGYRLAGPRTRLKSFSISFADVFLGLLATCATIVIITRPF